MQFEDTTKSTEILNTVSGEDTLSPLNTEGGFTVMDSHHQASHTGGGRVVF